ncbi:hypothetical protein CHH79_15365 [Bacillus siamensis]|uniref:hypothetical protein n=1 Tax=Bacillus siamensis TaxID=659243 RepID=UPI0005F8D962|nr:hypothetical protein [Bacillus siamensis]MED0773631.1 hypothetical protein [Bacillus siamensis]MED0775408.1 hypothetical protein [Bacillus siamensis]MED0781453.1 hypothetical protein [Bacillus siamensis]MED0834929.1 hypothetical protein [Bacillus siamensis]OAZ58431.1 uncharacterized protein SRCM100169_03926 [Bacillus siamensis]
MKKYISILFVTAIVLSGVLFAPSASASAFQVSTITGNHSFETANPVGYWKYKNIDTAVLPKGEKESYFTFTANKGERLYVRSSTRSEYKGMSIEIYNKNKVLVSKGTEVINPDTLLPFIYAITDAKENNETFYVKVSRGSYTDDIYFTLSIYDRIKAGSETFAFSGTAENKGNTSLSPNGSDSTVLRLDLTKQTSIPKDAIVKRISTTATQIPSQGNTRHSIMSEENKVWHRALANSSTQGNYGITLDDNLSVSSIWNFKYNTLATARSTMKNVKLKIDYEYDVTSQY